MDLNNKKYHLLLILIYIAIFYLCFLLCSKEKTEKKFSFPGIDTDILKLPSSVTEYLSVSSKYSSFYKQGKKFVIYFTGIDCPYGKTFQDRLELLAKTPSTQQEYAFIPTEISKTHYFRSRQEAEAEIEFNNLCHEFCLINPRKQELFYINGIGEKEAELLTDIFKTLQSW